MFSSRSFTLSVLLLAAPTAALAQSQIYQAPPEILAKMREEGTKRSQVMETANYLTDVIGGRLTGSPALARAGEWTRDRMAGQGLVNAHLESWGPFGRGWVLEDSSLHIEGENAAPLIGLAKAWSPSTPGPISADVIYWDNDKKDNLSRYKGKLKGKIVLISPTRELKPSDEPLFTRRDDTNLLKLSNATDPAVRAPQPENPPKPDAAERDAKAKERAEARAKSFVRNYDSIKESSARWNFWKDEGAALLIDNSFNGSGGTVFVAGASAPQPVPEKAEDLAKGRVRLQSYDPKAEARMVPQMTLASEDYNRLVRLVSMGEPVRLKANVKARYVDKDVVTANTIAEIPGSDLKDEIVMIGAHLDSWHGSTGATDNAAGVAVVMEAARIIKALDLKPRRTIRVALWTGEEEGIFGSTAYVKSHFGASGDDGKFVPGAEFDKLSAYYNLDNGSGKIRGMFAQGNTGAAPIFRAWLAPFADLGANTITLASTGSTDHIPFDRAGLPGFQFIQDGLDYFSRTHHSNEDNYDRLQKDDLQQASIIMAAFAYQTAMMDERLPRKPQN